MIRSAFRRVLRINWLFLVVVLLPTLFSGLYFGLIASDIYISESRFVVRSPQKQIPSTLGAILQGSSFGRSQDDTYTVHDYIVSRDALGELERGFGLNQAFSSTQVDRLSRFGGIDADRSFEALYKYYQKRVQLDVDGASSITTLRTSAFTAQQSRDINQKLLELSEKLVNQLNERGRQDMVRYATAEVAVAEERAKATTLAVSAFRTQKGVFDPERQSTLQLQLVSKLQDELIATKTQLAQIHALTKDNPQIMPLQKKLDTLEAEIRSENAKVAGGDRSLSSKSAEYERLALDRGFAEKQLAAALSAVELARNDAQRQQLYLERIVQPSLPDVAMEPRRLRSVLATFIVALVAWGVLTMLLAGVREHQD